MASHAMPQNDSWGYSNMIIGKAARYFLVFVLGLIALCGLMVVSLPTLLRNWAVSHLSDMTLTRVEIENLQLNLFTGHIHIGGLRVRSLKDHSNLLVIPKINADIDLFPLLNREVVLRRLDIESPVVNLVRTADAIWELPVRPPQSSAESTFGILLRIQHAVLRDGTLIVEDRSIMPVRPEHVTRIDLTMTDLSSGSPDPVKIHGSAMLSDSGTITLEGTVLSDFRAGTVQLGLTEVSLTAMQGYLSDHLIIQGQVDARLSVTWPGKGASLVGISGVLEGHDIALSSADRPNGEAATVLLSQIDIMWPDTVTMNRVVITKPKIWVHRNENGRFVGVGKRERASSTPLPASSSTATRSQTSTSTRWSINKIIIRDGTVHLEDRSVVPMYSDSLQNLELTLDEVISTPSHPVRITARADIASGGTLDIYGRASLLDPIPSASFKAAVHQFVVPSTNPYLEQTLSHHTTDGRLTSVMDIRLRGDQLEVTSHVTLSDLHVEPIRTSTSRTIQERIGLPLGLLIALLKDDRGRIAITFPVSGPLSNPIFDWTNAIWATIRNSVVKLIALPIRSIGRLITGNHQTDSVVLDPITFDPGSSTIRPAMERKLHELAKLLDSTNHTALHLTPILSESDLDALQHLPRESWPVPNLDTPETAGHVLAVRRAYLVAARVAGLCRVSAARLPVDPPRQDPLEPVMPTVELQLENTGEAIPVDWSLSKKEH